MILLGKEVTVWFLPVQGSAAMAYCLIPSRFEPKRYVVYRFRARCQVRGCDFAISVLRTISSRSRKLQHATDRRTDSSPHCCGRAGSSNPNYGWKISPQHLTRWGTHHLLRAEHEGTILYSLALCGLDTIMRLSESPQLILSWLHKQGHQHSFSCL